MYPITASFNIYSRHTVVILNHFPSQFCISGCWTLGHKLNCLTISLSLPNWIWLKLQSVIGVQPNTCWIWIQEFCIKFFLYRSNVIIWKLSTVFFTHRTADIVVQIINSKLILYFYPSSIQIQILKYLSNNKVIQMWHFYQTFATTRQLGFLHQ